MSELKSDCSLKDRLQMLQSLLTILALLGGAGWFWYQGAFGARISLSLSVVDVPINDQFAMVRVKTTIINSGLVAVNFKKRRITIAKISPPEESFEEQLFKFRDTRINGRYVVHYPYGAPPVELENAGSVQPGETEETMTEFVLLRCIRSIAVKSAMCSREFDCFGSEKIFIRDTSTTHVMSSYLGEEKCAT